MKNSDIPFVGPFIAKLFGTRNERFVKRYLAKADAITALEPEMRSLTDAQLYAKTDEFRRRLDSGERPLELMTETFAVAREVMDRNIGIRNIFNPELRAEFPADKLPESVRAVYDSTLAAMDAAEAREPENDLLGNTEPVPPWIWMDIPNEVYEAVRELFPESRPPFRARPFDVQLIGAMVLYQGRIAEMKTGEGKTIVAPLACYQAVLEGHRVHVVTVNDYLVQRDRDWVFPFFRGLGVTVGAIHPQSEPYFQNEDVKRVMYACDVIYGTTAEFGFDYLRDNMKQSVDQQVQRVRDFAIVDEVDSILIDEARTPLIISGPAHEDQPRYDLADQLARHLVEMQKPWSDADRKVQDCKKLIKGTEGDIRQVRDKSTVPELQKRLKEAKERLPGLEAERDRFTQYFEVELDKKQSNLTHHGIAEAQKKADLGSFYVGENTDLPHLLQQALRAHVVYERDRDYVVIPVRDPQTGGSDMGVVIVDTNTGRPMYGRQWSDGLHQAVEAKEGVRIKQETQTVATITIQNFFKMYKRLAGMTGTADTEAQEFHDIYNLDVVVIPTNLPVIRADHDDVVYLSVKDKWDAIVDEIKAFHDFGQPVLVGTTSVEKSEMLSRMLGSKYSIKHEVLNAKQHEREANIVEGAGRLGAVMIATNMAGRGTDIKLRRVTREELLDHWLRRGIAPRELTVEDSDEALREKVFRKIGAKELGLKKREVEEMPFPELETALLRHWAGQFTWADQKQLNNATAEQLMEMLDQQGRFRLHRIRWYPSIEEAGGLHVIGTERHESRRIDNQLRGRSGRQGDHGSSRFFVSLEDDLMKMFAGETTMRILAKLGMKEGDAIEHPMLSKALHRAQRKVEEHNFQIRKNILEYDEVMEHQRQEFYGMRQRVLDGRNIKGLIFDFIEASAVDAVDRYLDRDYVAECVAEFAKQKLSCSIPIERLRNRDRNEMIAVIRREAMDDARHEVNLTIGEYIPEGAEMVDIDTKGLINWAESRFGVELTSTDVHDLSVLQIKERLLEAAEYRIEETDLSDVDQYLVSNYGAQMMCKWIKRVLDLDVTVEEITRFENREDVVDAVIKRVKEAYHKREIEYPVDFMMEMTIAMMQQSPQQASENFVNWVNRRYNLGWDASVMRTRMPQQIRDELMKASKEFIESDAIDRAVEEALACKTTEELEQHLKERYNAVVPLWMRRLRGEERDEAVRARVTSLLRAELTQLERFILLEVLDPTWKDHLYEMDQLRDAIGFRAFSQQDPRIAFKKEGARLFAEMMERVRDRATDYVFKMRLSPRAMMQRAAVGQPRRPAPAGRPQGAPAQMQQRSRQAQAAGAAAPAAAAASAPARLGGSILSGPGIDRIAGGTTPVPTPPESQDGKSDSES